MLLEMKDVRVRRAWFFRIILWSCAALCFIGVGQLGFSIKTFLLFVLGWIPLILTVGADTVFIKEDALIDPEKVREIALSNVPLMLEAEEELKKRRGEWKEQKKRFSFFRTGFATIVSGVVTVSFAAIFVVAFTFYDFKATGEVWFAPGGSTQNYFCSRQQVLSDFIGSMSDILVGRKNRLSELQVVERVRSLKRQAEACRVSNFALRKSLKRSEARNPPRVTSAQPKTRKPISDPGDVVVNPNDGDSVGTKGW